MAPPRVKESCIPCRQRKSRCNAEIPCSSCSLRGTESDCHLPSQSGNSPSIRRPAKSSPHAYAPREDGGSGSRRPSSEHRRSASPSTSTNDRRRVPRPSGSIDSSPPSLEERHNWEKVLAALPPRAACEILLEYLIQECDWLCHFGDVVGTFHRAIARGGVTHGVAGMLCMYIAIPAMLLGDTEAPLYRPNIATREVHTRLWVLAQTFCRFETVDNDELELALAIWYYMIFSGLPAWSRGIQTPAVMLAEKAGFLDESAPSWDGLSYEERNTRRRIGWGLVMIGRWKLLFVTDDPLAHARINLCRPYNHNPQLSAPVRLPLPPRPGDEVEASFRVLRIKSPEEHGRVAAYRDMMMDIMEVVPRVWAYLVRMGTVDTDISLGECEMLYREVQCRLDERLPGAGFGRYPLEEIDFSDIVACRQVSQTLILRLAISHINAILLRHWLSVGDITPSSPSPHRRLYAACLDNAKRSMGKIPAVKAIVASRHGPMIAPFVSGNLFNAATSFAVPVLRAVRYYTSCNTEEDIRKLPLWPEHAYPTIAESRLDGSERFSNSAEAVSGLSTMRLPSNIYTDSTVYECATNILVILDALSELNASPIGAEAEKRLAALIHQYGLRDSQHVQAANRLLSSSHLSTFPAIDPTTIYNVDDRQTQATDQDTNAGADFNFLNTLLQMDGSIWEGLLEAGAITRTDGQPLAPG